MAGDRVELADGSVLYWLWGILHSSCRLPCGGEFYHDRLELPGRWFSAPVARALAGRPATDIVDHPALIGIIVHEVVSEFAEGRAATGVTLEVPVSFFDARSGRAGPCGVDAAG